MKLYIKSIAYSLKLIYKSTKFTIGLYFILKIILSTVPLINTYIIKCIFDMLSVRQPDITQLSVYIALYVAVLLISNALSSFNGIIYDGIYKKADHEYEKQLLGKLTDLPMSVIDSSWGKDATNEVRRVKGDVLHSVDNLIDIVAKFYTFAVAFIVIAKFDIVFSTIFLILTIPGILVDIIWDSKMVDLQIKTAPDMRKFSYYRWMLTDAGPAKDVRMYNLTESIKARHDEEKNKFRDINKQLDKKRLLGWLLAEIIRRSGEITFTVFVITKAVRGEIGIGDITLYIGYSVTAGDSFQSAVSALFMSYRRITKLMKYFYEFMALGDQPKNGCCRNLCDFESLEFQNVYFKYPMTETYVLQGVDFILKKGDKMSIVGINGSGKSTIVKLILGLYKINSGRILINGHPMEEYDIKDVRRLFSVLFQGFAQYPLTLRENIVLSDIEKNTGDDEAVVSAMKKSGVYDEIESKLNHGLDSYMTRQFDEEGVELSRGQWQKIALARAYYKDAPIVIFDEPSAALDAEAEDRIFRNFEEVSGDKTCIMISHRISSARMSNVILVLDGGKITEVGNHEELVQKDGLYSKLYNLQKQKYTMKEDAVI